MIEALESRELFSATLAAGDAGPQAVPAKPLFAWYVEDLDGRRAGGTAVAMESLVVTHEGLS